MSGSAEWLPARKDDPLNILEVEHPYRTAFFPLLADCRTERDTMGLWSSWSFSLLASVLLYPFHPKFVAQAEISFPRNLDRFYRLEATPLEARVARKSSEIKVSLEVDNGTKVLSAFGTEAAGALKPNSGQQVRNEIQKEDEEIEIKPNGVKTPDKKYGAVSEDSRGRADANIMSDSTFSVSGRKAKRSAGETYSDRSTSGDVHSEAVQGVSGSRAEYRRAGEEPRGSNPRQNEPHLDTSTFALSGDSAHNQAMVHWSGHNSSVSFRFT